jgi:uncharacterized protein (TIGR03435 family)
MTRTSLYLAAATIAFVTSLHAQSIAGTWQGTLSPPNSNSSVRLVFTIAKNPDASLRGGLKYIDNDFGFAFSSVTFAAPDLALAQDSIGLTFQATLSADGHTLTGTWGQGKQSLPLTLSLATPDTLWKPAGPPPMAANADPSYEVAVIKPAPPEEQHPIYNLTGPEFHATGTSAGELIKIVYRIRGRQILNMPPWVADTKFDITAKPDTPGVASEDQTRIMVKKLLADRFHFVCHTGTHDFPSLAMTLDPKGPHPIPSDPDLGGHNSIIGRQEGGDVVLHLTGATMQFFLKTLMDRYRDKQIVDETGLTGAYDITLRLPAAAMQGIGDGGAEEETGSDYISAAEKAGFKFVSRKEALPVVIIDHIDQPTPN